jgi:hypothetical protein
MLIFCLVFAAPNRCGMQQRTGKGILAKIHGVVYH